MERNEEKTLEIALRNFRVPDLRRDRASYRDARTHLKTGPDTDEQGQCWRRSPDFLGRSGRLRNTEKVNRGSTNQLTDQPMDRHTKV